MKAELFLINKYVKSYPKRCVGVVLCIFLFLFSFLTVLLYRDSYQFSLEENSRRKNGAYTEISFGADVDLVKKNRESLSKEGAGIMSGLYQVIQDNADINTDIWIGTADKNLKYLLPITLISGEFPQNENEIAIEKFAYNILGLTQKIGDTVNLTIKNEEGKTEKRTYILTGILQNYSKKIRIADSNGTIIPIPNIFTADHTSNPVYTHIFAKEESDLISNMNAVYSYPVKAYKYEVAQKNRISEMILIPMAVFFILATILGVFSTITYFFKEQESYLNLLRCIGFSKKRSRILFYLQGTILWIISWASASLFSVLAMIALRFASSFSEQKLYICFKASSFLAAGALGFVLIFLSLIIMHGRFYHNPPLRQTVFTPKKVRRSVTSLRRCWHKAYGRKHRFQTITCIMLIFFCVGMAVFGSFLPLFNARGASFDNPDDYPDDTDYSLHMLGGSSAMDSFYINFPVKAGVPREIVEEFMEDDRVEVLEASVTHLCIPFFLSSKNPVNPLLYHYVITAKNAGYDFTFKNAKSDEMIELAGGNPKEDCLVELPFKWQTYSGIKKDYPVFTDGYLNEEKFKNGEEIIAPDIWCEVGSEYTIIIPVPDKDATVENILEHVHFETRKMRVAATYPVSETDTLQLVLSSEYLFSVNRTLNYEVLLLKNRYPDDSAWTEELNERLEMAEASSSGIQYDNYAEMAKDFYERVYAEMLQLIVCVTIFVVVILTAIVLSTYVQIRSNLQSYMMMRAVGAGIDMVKKLIIRETNRILTTGILIGSALGWGVCIYFAKAADYVKTKDIFMFYVTPVFILVIVLLYLGVHFAVGRAVRPLLSRNIVEELNTAE